MRTWPDRPSFWLILFATYAVAVSALRFRAGWSITGDEAESFLWSLSLEWGYGVQPPLYSWLHWGVNRLLGETAVSVAAMRSLCLFAVYAAAFSLARRFQGVAGAGMAALSLVLVTEIGQTFLRTRTHNMLAVALVLLATWAFLRMIDRGWRRDHVAFGALAALGVLAKGTAVAFPMMLILAALTMPAPRAALLKGRALIGLGVALVLLAGPALWSWHHFALATASTAKFEVTGDRVQGALRTLRALGDAFGLPALILGLGWFATRGPLPPMAERRLVFRAGALALGLVAVAILVAGATEVKERWLVAVLIPVLPVAAAAVLSRRGWGRVLPAAVAGLAALAFLAALPAKFARREYPLIAGIAPMADAIAVRGATLILTEKGLAASLALAHPGLPARERLDSEDYPCRGDVILIRPAGVPDDRAGFLAHLDGCTATATEETVLPPVGDLPALHLLRLTLAPRP